MPFADPEVAAAYARSPRRMAGKLRAQIKFSKTEAGRVVHKRATMMYRYGVTPDRYQEMLVSQNGSCAICKRPATFQDPPPNKPWTNLVIDHCHKTGKIRGLLCRRCNGGLGIFGDNIEGIRAVLAYLESVS